MAVCVLVAVLATAISWDYATLFRIMKAGCEVCPVSSIVAKAVREVRDL